MPWRRFFIASAAGGVVWTSLYGLGAYYLGKQAGKFELPFTIGLGAAGIIGIAIIFLTLRRHEGEFAAEAAMALPGPLRPLHEQRRPEA
jgi:membrane protein DedA with SNARE-associated domain